MTEKIPDIITFKMIYLELMNIKRDLQYLKLRDIENITEEITLNKASEWLRRNPEFLKSEVKKGNLKAIIGKTQKGDKKKYYFRVCDLYDWQKRRVWKSSEQVYNDISGDLEIQDRGSTEWAKQFIENFHKHRKVGHNAHRHTGT